ncbi:hypothetical protein EKH57_00010 (plasmid) [Halorubrum sp. BOL3-1]|uniref:hypothetical protein n=1 Tax=Halorubrum sp. BOL3-1 TaxID=2497325 RepID=UPI001004DDB7|nr:hypothetical protein [Halorubrum sp. BOL3-1]QAU11318.1 hypothetical protein EKH57_00010 [Halorubrum sp. BOL3-1]
MSELIAAKAKGELLERYKAQRDRLDEDATESELIRELLREGLDAREAPLFARIDLPDKYAARVEDAREAGESDEELLRRLLRDLVRGWDDDALDELGASDELRQRVEAEREAGESLGGAVERLLRRGVEAPTGPLSLKTRMVLATGFCAAGALGVYAWVVLGPPSVVVLAAFAFVFFGFYPQIEDVTGRLTAE